MPIQRATAAAAEAYCGENSALELPARRPSQLGLGLIAAPVSFLIASSPRSSMGHAAAQLIIDPWPGAPRTCFNAQTKCLNFASLPDGLTFCCLLALNNCSTHLCPRHPAAADSTFIAPSRIRLISCNADSRWYRDSNVCSVDPALVAAILE